MKLGRVALIIAIAGAAIEYAINQVCSGWPSYLILLTFLLVCLGLGFGISVAKRGLLHPSRSEKVLSVLALGILIPAMAVACVFVLLSGFFTLLSQIR